MAVIGTLGDIIFSVSAEQINTFDNLKWSNKARFATHERHLQSVLLEFTGNEADEISFEMCFSAFCGVTPLEEIAKLLNAEREGKIMPLIIGTHWYGTYRWVITGTQFALTRYDKNGDLLEAKVTVTLKAYGQR